MAHEHVVLVDSTPAGLAVIEAAKNMNARVTFVRSNRFSPLYVDDAATDFIAQADAVLEIENAVDVDALIAVLSQLHKENSITALISPFEQTVFSVAKAAEAMGLPFTSSSAVANARAKDCCRRIVESNGVPAVGYSVVEGLAEAKAKARQFGFPVLIKPTSGAGSMAVSLIEHEGQLDTYFASLNVVKDHIPMGISKGDFATKFLIEEFIEGQPISVEIAVSQSGTVTPFMVSQRPASTANPVLALGTLMPADIPAEIKQQAVEQATKIIHALEVNFGFFHIEMIISENGPRLVEVNPRLMGGNMAAVYRAATGQNVFENLVRIHMGEEWLDENRTDGAACCLLFAPAKQSKVRKELTQAELADFNNNTEGFQLNVRTGDTLRRFANHYDAVGHLIVRESNPSRAVDRAKHLLLAVSERIGVAFY